MDFFSSSFTLRSDGSISENRRLHKVEIRLLSLWQFGFLSCDFRMLVSDMATSRPTTDPDAAYCRILLTVPAKIFFRFAVLEATNKVSFREEEAIDPLQSHSIQVRTYERRTPPFFSDNHAWKWSWIFSQELQARISPLSKSHRALQHRSSQIVETF